MNNNIPGPNEYDAQYPPMDTANATIHSPPKTSRVTRKEGAIEKKPDRTDDANNGKGTKSVTPRTAEATNLRENKDLKRSKMQQTIKGFMEEVSKNKQEKIKRNVVAQVREKRLQSGKRLVPWGRWRDFVQKEQREPGRKLKMLTRTRGPIEPSRLGQATATAKLSHQ